MTAAKRMPSSFSSLASIAAICFSTMPCHADIGNRASSTDWQQLSGRWRVRIDGGGEIYSAKFNFKVDDEATQLSGDYQADGKKVKLERSRLEDGLHVLEFETRRRGMPVRVSFAFVVEDDKLVGDVDFDSGTSVRSYEFEASRTSGGKKIAAENKMAEKAEQPSDPTLAKKDNSGKKLPAKTTGVERITFQQGAEGYLGTVDTEIWAIAPSRSLHKQGTLTADGNNGGGESQVLMRFADVFGSGERQVPRLSRIVSAKLVVVAFDPGSTIYLHRTLAPWDDSATWDGMASGVSVDNIEASTVRDGFNFGEINMDKQSIEFDVTATVRKWASGEPNYGWVFVSTGSNGWDFYSADWIESDLRPQLEVRFARPAVPTKDASAPNSDPTRK